MLLLHWLELLTLQHQLLNIHDDANQPLSYNMVVLHFVVHWPIVQILYRIYVGHIPLGLRLFRSVGAAAVVVAVDVEGVGELEDEGGDDGVDSGSKLAKV